MTLLIGPVALPVEEHDGRPAALIDVVNPATIDLELFVLERIDLTALGGHAVEQSAVAHRAGIGVSAAALASLAAADVFGYRVISQ